MHDTQRSGMTMKRWLVGILSVLIPAALLLGYAFAADPGSKDDPLATVGYVRGHAQFVPVELQAGESLRLGIGSELVVVCADHPFVQVGEFNPLRDTFIDLSAGETLRLAELAVCHHYLNASGHDVFIRPVNGCSVMVRGEYK